MQAIPHPISGLRNATVHGVLAPCSPARASARQGGANAEGVNLGNVARLAKSRRVLYIDKQRPAITRPDKGGYGTWDLTTHILCPVNETLNPSGEAFHLTFANAQCEYIDERVHTIELPWPLLSETRSIGWSKLTRG